MKEKQTAFLKMISEGEEWAFERESFCALVDEALSDRSEDTLREFTAWMVEIREALDQRLGHYIHVPLLENRFDSEWGHALSLHYRNKDRVWDTKSEVAYFTKMVESFKAQGVKWDPTRVFFLTVPSSKEMPRALSADNVANQVNGWHQSESMGKRIHGKTWGVLQTKGVDFTGKDEVFWWEGASNVSESDAKDWIRHLDSLNFIPATPYTCTKTLGGALLNPSTTGLPFYKGIKHWEGTPEASRKALAGGRRSKKGLGKETPKWSKDEVLSSKRVAWHLELLNPKNAQSLPLFMVYFAVPNEFWEEFAPKSPHRIWAEVMMQPSWLERLGAVGDIDGGWRTNGGVLALETDARLRLAEKHPEVDEAVRSAMKSVKNAAKIMSHWEQLRLEWRHSEFASAHSAKPAL